MDPRRRMQLYRTMHLWHWISAAVCFAALTLFTVTGITLNHASAISAEPEVTSGEARLPENLRATLATANTDVVPADIAAWAEDSFDVSLRDAAAEWSEEELYLSAPGPGRDAWVSIDRASGTAKYESTDRGWLAYFNDLHKGRNTGIAWIVFIDVVAVAVLFFSLTGLVLLWIQARQRKSTWPLVGGGIALVTVLMIFLVH
ncbi:MAG TPA: PepSY-associated TM helix domain-containing protein [Steroidobacteraceae bacterium]